MGGVVKAGVCTRFSSAYIGIDMGGSNETYTVIGRLEVLVGLDTNVRGDKLSGWILWRINLVSANQSMIELGACLMIDNLSICSSSLPLAPRYTHLPFAFPPKVLWASPVGWQQMYWWIGGRMLFPAVFYIATL